MKMNALIILLFALPAAGCSGKSQGPATAQAPPSQEDKADETPPSGQLPGYVREPSLGERPKGDRGREDGSEGNEAAPPLVGVEVGALGAIEKDTGEVAASLPAGPITEKWSASIGFTTYRSTIHFFDGKIVVNSNGNSWKGTGDPQDGVYILEPSKGNVIKQIAPPGKDEKDCNGVALTKNAMVFGTDQEMIYKTDWKGNVLWQKKLNGDIEAAPALGNFNGDKILDVAVGSEGGVFYALNGKNGKVLWQVAAGKGYYGQTGFVGAAALYDATGDGIDDVFVPCRDELFRALNGKNGKTIWSYQGGSGMHGAPIIVDADADGKMEVVFTESYSDVYCANAKTGTMKWTTTLSNPSAGIEGLFSPVGWYPDAQCVLVGTAWWGQGEGVYCIAGKDGKTKWRYGVPNKNVSSGAVIGDVDGQPGAETVFGTESGKIVALNENGMTVWTYKLGGPIECTPTLADIDGDGLTEVIAAANDGALYVLETSGKAPPAIGYHRGDPENRANL